jgi:hypothetical protein
LAKAAAANVSPSLVGSASLPRDTSIEVRLTGGQPRQNRKRMSFWSAFPVGGKINEGIIGLWYSKEQPLTIIPSTNHFPPA